MFQQTRTLLISLQNQLVVADSRTLPKCLWEFNSEDVKILFKNTIFNTIY